MKIMFLARYLPQEGSTTHIYTLAKALIKRGHEVHLMSAGPKDDLSAVKIYNDVLNEGLQHHKVSFPLKPSFTKVGKIKQLMYYILVIPKALKILREIKPDIMHVHYPVTSYIAKIYRILSGKKFITTHHITGIPMHPLHKKADYVIAISNELKVELMSKFNYSDEEVELIYNGVSKEKFSQMESLKNKLKYKQEMDIPLDTVVLGFVGSFNRRKGIDILLKACASINSKFHIVLLGDGDKEWVNSLVKENKLDERVSIFPFQDPLKFYSIFDIFILPSRQEGFPLVPIEAMMMNIPIIRSNVEGAYDQIHHNESGFIFKNENVNELKKYLELLILDSDLRKKMGDQSREKALNNFTDEIMINKLLHLYNKAK